MAHELGMLNVGLKVYKLTQQLRYVCHWLRLQKLVAPERIIIHVMHFDDV